jgi:predicted Ser/Thr protein kinase
VRQNGEVSPLVLGEEFAGCRVEEVIGRGGMGVVYRGTDLTLERPVAIKLIAADRAGDEAARRRFEREARLTAAIDHPNVIPVYGAGEQNGDLYLVMRYVDGTDLQHRIREAGAMAPAEAARVIDQVARALDAAHRRGLVHRDIKPANVLLSGDHVYLTDFGITRLVDEGTHATETGEWVGTVDFMSPEHLRGEETDARADVYSLGCVLYACLTGVPPFKRMTTPATIGAHLHDRPPAPSLTHPGVPRGFDQIVGRALAKRPEHRYASAGELGEAAVAAAAGRPTRWGKGIVKANANHGPSESPTRPKAAAAAKAKPRRSTQDPAEVATQADAGDEVRTRIVPGDEVRTRIAPGDEVPPLHLSGDGDGGEAEARRRGPLVVAAATVLVAIAAVVAVLALRKSTPKPLLPLSRTEVSSVVDAFAAAYSGRDSTALSKLLAPNITREDPSGVQHGAAAVLADYRRQFNTKPVPLSYRVSRLVVTGGWVGRASGTYTLKLRDGTSLTGHVVFAVQRIGGTPMIGLILTQERSATA